MKPSEIDNENILDDKYIWLICPKCKNIPNITPKIDKDIQEGTIDIQCRCNNYKNTQYTIKEYIDLITKQQKKKMRCTKNPAHSAYEAVNYCFQCQEFLCSLCNNIHKTLNKNHIISDEALRIDKICDRHLTENKIIAYCTECYMNLCQQCLKDHDIHHNIVDILSLFPKNLSDKTFEDFKLIQVTFFKYLSEAKKNFDDYSKTEIEKIENQNDIKKKINELNDIYQKNININQDLVKLISLMFENYHNSIDNFPNFNIINQLKNLTKFNNNLKQFSINNEETLENNIKNFIEYLKTTYIIKSMNTPLVIEDKILLNEAKNIRAIISLSNDNVCVGNWQSDLLIINLTEKKITKTITGHFSGINTICSYNNKYIITGGQDCAINLYDPLCDNLNSRKENCYKGFINGHDNSVSKVLQLRDGRVVTCGYDNKINIFGKIQENELKDDLPVIEYTEEELKEKEEREKKEREKKEKEEREQKEKEEKEKEKKEKKEKKEEKEEKDKKEESGKKDKKEKKEKKEEKEEKKEDEKKEEENKEEEKEKKEENENEKKENENENEEKEKKEENEPKDYYLSFEKLFTFETTGKVLDVTGVKDGSLIACVSDNTIKIYEIEKNFKEIKSIKFDILPYKIVALPDGRICVAFKISRKSHTVKIFKIDENKDLKLEHEFSEHTGDINSLYLLEDGKIVSVSSDGTAVFYNPYEFKVVCKIKAEKRQKFTCVTQMEDRTVVISSNKGVLYVLQ